MVRWTEVAEGRARISFPEGVFFNPQMGLCRDFSSLAAGALGGKRRTMRVADATAASGVRGIRYWLENRNVGEVSFVDLRKDAIAACRRNARGNGLKGARFFAGPFDRFAIESRDFDLIEIDPFGTPVPFLYDAVRAAKGGAALSVTATDMAVLCGAHPKACLKNYQAKPLNSEYCHEAAIRILLGKIARTVSEFNFGIKPVASLSHLHYVKVFVLLEEGAEKAVESLKTLGFVAHCNKCLNREWRKGIANSLPAKCPECGASYEYGGPMWLGELHDGGFLREMGKLNGKRDYAGREKIAKFLSLMGGEIEMPPFYYDLHALCKKAGCRAAKPETAIGKLRKAGFRAVPTHFRFNSVKTDAPFGKVARAIK